MSRPSLSDTAIFLSKEDAESFMMWVNPELKEGWYFVRRDSEDVNSFVITVSHVDRIGHYSANQDQNGITLSETVRAEDLEGLVEKLETNFQLLRDASGSEFSYVQLTKQVSYKDLHVIQDWYHGDIFQDTAEMILAQYRSLDGAYLVRPCGSDPRNFVLAFIADQEIFSVYLKIKESNIMIGAVDVTLTSIFQVVKYFCQVAIYRDITLNVPAKRMQQDNPLPGPSDSKVESQYLFSQSLNLEDITMTNFNPPDVTELIYGTVGTANSPLVKLSLKGK